MTTPNPTSVPAQSSGFSPEELAAFGIHPDPLPPPPVKEERKGPSAEELAQLQAQALREQAQQTALLRAELAHRATAPQPEPETKLPARIAVSYDDKGQGWINPQDVLPFVQGTVQQYHKEMIAPVAPSIEALQQAQTLDKMVQWVKTNVPEVAETITDHKMLAGHALGLYNSPLNPGTTDADRTTYVVNQLKQFPALTGNPLLKDVATHNQMGRTAVEVPPEISQYPKGHVFNITRPSAADIGYERFNDLVAEQRRMQEFSDHYQMNWRFNVKSAL